MAKQASDRNRVGCAVSPTIFAAVNAPQPGSSSSRGARWRTRAVISRSRALTRRVRARMSGYEPSHRWPGSQPPQHCGAITLTLTGRLSAPEPRDSRFGLCDGRSRGLLPRAQVRLRPSEPAVPAEGADRREPASHSRKDLVRVCLWLLVRRVPSVEGVVIPEPRRPSCAAPLVPS
jgi:hypothetical protein